MTVKVALFASLALALASGCSNSASQDAARAAAGAKQAGYVPLDTSPQVPGTSQVKGGTIGTLKWEVYEVKTGTKVSEGDRDIALDEVVIQSVSDYHKKTIRLGDHFTLGVSGDPSGFALQALRDDKDTFSWDWFNPDGSGRATKLQEFGEVAVGTATTPNGVEIARLEFLTDVSFRIDDMSQIRNVVDARKFDPFAPAWRVKVFKGSVIVWPSLVKGVLVGN